MNQTLEAALERVETFRATRYKPIPILSAPDIALAEALAGKRKKSRRRRAGQQPKLKLRPGAKADPYRNGLSFKYWNHYRWQLDICEVINVASPGYLAHLAGISNDYAEPLRERWELWCKNPVHYIPQAIRQNFWDYWQAWVDAGELTRFKDDLFALRGDLVQPRFTSVYCMQAGCRLPTLAYQVRYTLVLTDTERVVGLIPTVDDQADPAGEAGRVSNGYAVLRRRCPWCGEHNVYWVEVDPSSDMKEAIIESTIEKEG
jgi:hypothetical protein